VKGNPLFMCLLSEGMHAVESDRHHACLLCGSNLGSMDTVGWYVTIINDRFNTVAYAISFLMSDTRIFIASLTEPYITGAQACCRPRYLGVSSAAFIPAFVLRHCHGAFQD
jgi:hypothetical protein